MYVYITLELIRRLLNILINKDEMALMAKLLFDGLP